MKEKIKVYFTGKVISLKKRVGRAREVHPSSVAVGMILSRK